MIFSMQLLQFLGWGVSEHGENCAHPALAGIFAATTFGGTGADSQRGAVTVEFWGIYLGFATGLGRVTRSWDKPLLKSIIRVSA